MIKLENFISKEAARKLRGHNLHKIAAIMTSARYGMQIDEMTLPAAISLIGSRAFYKRAMDSKIIRGLQVMKELSKEKGGSNV